MIYETNINPFSAQLETPFKSVSDKVYPIFGYIWEYLTKFDQSQFFQTTINPVVKRGL